MQIKRKMREGGECWCVRSQPLKELEHGHGWHWTGPLMGLRPNGFMRAKHNDWKSGHDRRCKNMTLEKDEMSGHASRMCAYLKFRLVVETSYSLATRFSSHLRWYSFSKDMSCSPVINILHYYPLEHLRGLQEDSGVLYVVTGWQITWPIPAFLCSVPQGVHLRSPRKIPFTFSWPPPLLSLHFEKFTCSPLIPPCLPKLSQSLCRPSKTTSCSCNLLFRRDSMGESMASCLFMLDQTRKPCLAD